MGMAVLRIRTSYRWKFDDLAEFVGVIERVKRGTILHKALSLIERPADADSVRRAVVKGLLLLGESPSRWDVEGLARCIERVLGCGDARPFFPEDPEVRVYSEREFLKTPTEVLRPDRVVEYEDRVLVVDFKASRPSSLKLYKSYADQVKKYVSVVSDFFKRPAEGYLLFIEPPRVERVV